MPAKKYRLDGYRKAAKKEPFILVVDDETEISIKAPSNRASLAASKISEEDLEGQLRIVFGESYDEVMEAIGDDTAEVLSAILKDVSDHFGVDQGESNG